MSDELKPTDQELVDRLAHLSDAVTKGKSGWAEFTMRIPPNPKRDADFVLRYAAERIADLSPDLNTRPTDPHPLQELADNQQDISPKVAAVVDECFMDLIGPTDQQQDHSALWGEAMTEVASDFFTKLNDAAAKQPFGFNVEIDNSVPVNEVHFKDGGRTVGKIVNLSDTRQPGEEK